MAEMNGPGVRGGCHLEHAGDGSLDAMTTGPARSARLEQVEDGLWSLTLELVDGRRVAIDLTSTTAIAATLLTPDGGAITGDSDDDFEKSPPDLLALALAAFRRRGVGAVNGPREFR